MDQIKASFASSLGFKYRDRDSADDVLAHAAHLDRAGEWDEAIAAYRDAAERWPEHTQYIDNCIAGIRAKQSAAS